ncbi:MAG: ArsC family reductase [Alphaproteobacteria bacterium]|nr:ArsC family reductase [Alphaproteobacteria bacterium]NCQ88522.1 ArsC family reductase [Alphaproteobacteria bacterium]NCT06065.1 ArsC family reductase [Alphaproteobacteria bacterium]
MIKIYGIKNCDTMIKAFQWLDGHNIKYVFHDYKKSGVDETVLEKAITENGWETIINKHGTTWRALDNDVKIYMNAESAIQIAINNPSIIKRPIIIHENKFLIGFNVQKYQHLLNK